MRDIGVNPETGVYSMDCSKAGNIPVYSTTRLLQLIPKQFTMNGVIHMPMIGFGEMNEFGLSKNECFIFNTSTLEPYLLFPAIR